jgi:hypothetical protein
MLWIVYAHRTWLSAHHVGISFITTSAHPSPHRHMIPDKAKRPIRRSIVLFAGSGKDCQKHHLEYLRQSMLDRRQNRNCIDSSFGYSTQKRRLNNAIQVGSWKLG